jgi:hypothetical protein
MKKTIKLSERTINHMKEFNDRLPTKYVIEDIAKELGIECDWFTTSLQDLGVTRAYICSFKYEVEVHF